MIVLRGLSDQPLFYKIPNHKYKGKSQKPNANPCKKFQITNLRLQGTLTAKYTLSMHSYLLLILFFEYTSEGFHNCIYDYRKYRCKAGIRKIVVFTSWGGSIVSYASFFNSAHLYDVMDQNNNKKNLLGLGLYYSNCFLMLL
jgi:hypothetical protein